VSWNIDGRALSTLLDPYKELVVISFDRLRRLCRHEKAVTARRLGANVRPNIALKSKNKD